ncbi:hypothetical protein CK203_100507 [Vitis vinifera]|uniref:Synergin gamma C-terminal domain-containing protein n=1 Tax=Vitis vinifera TaxID=29760 RepID=A0A438F0W2_VITVI|nr:hypothetical protein CK203_100507 [Vitis vinifera]
MAEISSVHDGDEGLGISNLPPSQIRPSISIRPTAQISPTMNGAISSYTHSPMYSPHSIIVQLSQTAKPFDPFGFFPNDSAKPSESVVSCVDSVPTRSESEKKQWVKPQGALPLSIFGEEEEEKKRRNLIPPSPRRLSITNDQNQQIKGENGSPAVSNGRNLNSNSDSNALHADLVDGDDGFDDDDGWEFKGAVSENSKVQVGSGLLGLEVETTAKQEMQAGQENPDGGKYTSGFCNALDGSRDFFAAPNGLWQESSNGAKRMSGFHNAPDSSGDFCAASNGLWQENSEGAKYASGFHHAPHNSSSFFDASNVLWQESEGTENTSGFYNAPDNSSGFFDASNGLWQESRGSGFHIASDSSSDFFDASNELWQENPEASKQVSGLHNAPDNSGVLFAASTELWQENSGGENYTSGSTDPFAVSNGLSYEPSKLDIGFDFKPTLAQNDIIADSNSTGKLIDSENVLKPYLGDENVDPDENFGEFKDAFSETELMYEEEQKLAGISHPGVQVPKFDGGIQENEGKPVNHKGALPLSMFSYGELETDDSLNHQDFLAYKPNSNPRNDTTLQASNISINDLISMLDSDIVNGSDDFDADSWEFKDAFSGAKAEDMTSAHGIDNAHQNFSTKVELKDYVDFYLKLKEESCFVALCHLTKAKTDAALSGEDVKAVALDEEIKEACKELSQENMLPKEVNPENGPPRNICLDGFLEDLCGPKFQVLESEYHLSRRLSLAEKDLRSAVELFKHAASTLKILMLGSMDEVTNYVSTWSRMISVCAQELKQGAFIWKQSLQKNVHNQILFEPRDLTLLLLHSPFAAAPPPPWQQEAGQKFILALGEIYRVVKVLGASARLFKLWVLLSSAKVDIFVLLEECSTIWSSSGLEDALHCICDPVGFEYDATVQALLASIKHVHDLDVLPLQNHILLNKNLFVSCHY